MERTFNPEMLILARESRGFTQSELSNLLEISQGKISKIEQGFILANTELINELSKILNYPIDFFYGAFKIHTGVSYHRKRMSLSSKILNSIDARINIRMLHLNKLLKGVEFINTNIPFFDKEDYQSPDEIAIKLRHYWKIPNGPVNNLIEIIESNGGVVIMFDFQTKKIDGLSLIMKNMPPVFYLNDSIPMDRLRFTLAHELGHLVMHEYTTENMEAEADLFASAFLMPKSDISYQLLNLDFYKLPDLKRIWKVSMASLIMRASMLGLITPNKKKSLWVQLSKAGFKTREPIDLPKEIPSLLNEIICLYAKELNYTDEEISKLLLLNVDEFIHLYKDNKRFLRLYSD